ncbi:unnamed protein product [Paramecium octaurelia]|uniref:Uncharacterized protein n=1 Tax=Paramecium octaurelia TaxID=43137 RepID=A0A8S1TDP2_PAROT|nr:unnamed protein product [Paramecium octaurelia]
MIKFKFSQLFLYYSLILQQTFEFSCQFDNFENSLLDLHDPFQNVSFDVQYESDYWYSSGFWSKYIEYQMMHQSHVIGSKDLDLEKGRLLFLQKQMSNKGKKEYNITVYQKFAFSAYYWSYNPYHVLEVSYIENSKTEFQSMILQLENQHLDGIWHLTLIEYNPDKKILLFKSAGKFGQIDSISLKSGLINYIIGGYGKDSFTKQSYAPFYGLLSKLIIQNQHKEPNLYDYIVNSCIIPKQVVTIEQISLLDGIQNFDGTYYLHKEAQLMDQHYVIRGWIKIDVSMIFISAQMQILRMTINKQYQVGNGNNGDKTVFLRYNINLNNKDLNSILIQTYHYYYPYKSEYESSFLDSDKYMLKSNTLLTNIQQWHYFTFEQGRSLNSERTQYKLWFDLQSEPITHNFQFNEARNQFSNTQMYFYIGGDKFTPSPYFQGQLAKLEFLTGFQEDFNLQNFKYCHYSCQLCDGPESNQCTSCSAFSKRQLLSETQECKCQNNELDINNSEICSDQLQAFPKITILSINNNNYNDYCNFGYFLIKDNNKTICKQCPFYNLIQYYCLDCYIKPMTWYIQPVCTMDMIRNEKIPYSAYLQSDRELFDYDVFIINEIYELELQIGVQHFLSNQENNNNIYISAIHLGNYVHLQCKSNFILVDNKCKKCPDNCLKCDNNSVCLICQSEYYLSNNQCVICPSICDECYQDESSLDIICKQCRSPFNYVDKTCRQCGQFCQECIEDYNSDTEKYFLRCLKCLDDSKYFISNDAQNCEINEINNCQYAVKLRIKENDKTTFTTLDYYFKPSYDSIDIKCARCKEKYSYDYDSNKCEIDYNYGEKCIYRISWFYTYCIVGSEAKFELTNGCQSEISFCTNCLYNEFKEKKECYQCEQGYYASRIFGNCQICPLDFNCKTCYQQDKISQDNWKQQVRSFYYAAIQYYDMSHDFTEFSQSSEIEDFEIVCLECVQGFELFDKQCIPQCPTLCQECVKQNGQNICVKCPLEVNQRIISLYNNQCIQCPPNCILCRRRDQAEVLLINPIFQNANYWDYSNQCLGFDSGSNLYYNSFFGLVFQYIDTNPKQESQIILELNLICSDIIFQNLTFGLDDSQINLFNQTHLFIDDLQYFTHFNKESFYKLANDQQITSLEIKIISDIEQECLFVGDFLIPQIFSRSIFPLIQVNLSIISTQTTKFIVSKSLQFQDFSNILISDVEFYFRSKDSFNLLIFSSLLYQFQVQFNNLRFQQSNNNAVQLIFLKVSSIIFQNLTFSQFILKQQNYTTPLFLINFAKNVKAKFKIYYLQILDSQIQDTDVFSLNNDSLKSEFLHILLTGVFSNCTFIKTATSTLSTIKISNFSLRGELYNCNGFLQLSDFSAIIFQQLSIIHSIIQSSNVTKVNSNLTIYQFNCSNNIIFNQSKLFINQENTNKNQFSLSLDFIVFEYNQYDQLSNFLNIRDFGYVHSYITINNIQIIENKIYFAEVLNVTIKYEIALINLEAQVISLSQIFLLRGFGISELRIINSQNLLIRNIEVLLSEKYSIKGIHKYLDCWINDVKQDFYTIFLIIYNAIQTQIKSMIMRYLVVMNEPLIYYESISTSIFERDETINIYYSKIHDNLLISIGKYENCPIFEIHSQQNVSIQIEEIEFLRNILTAYQQEDSYISSSLLYFDCQISKVILHKVIFESNTIINSVNSLVLIKAQSVNFDDIVFNNSCQFDYNLIKPYLQWGYDLESKIYLEDIRLSFQQKCLVGNTILQASKILINNLTSNNSFGQLSGSLQLKVQLSGSVLIEQSKFESIFMASSKQYDSVQLGGTIYIESQSSITVNIVNSVFSAVNSYVSAGILYLNDNQNQITLLLENLTVNNCYSLKGAILYRQISSYNLTNQNFILQDINIQDTYQGFLNYQNSANYYYYAVKQLKNYLLSDRTKIYLISGNIQMDNVNIQQIYYESLIIGINLLKFFFSSSIIQGGILPIYGLINLYNQGYGNECVIRQVLISNLTSNLDSIKFDDPIQINSTKFIEQQQICLTKFNNDYAPVNLKAFHSPDYYYNNTLILFNEWNLYYQKQSIMPIIILTNITNLVQYKFIQLQFQDIICQACSLSLLYLHQNEERIKTNKIGLLQFKSNICGQLSCLIIADSIISRSDVNIKKRLLYNEYETEKHIQQVKYDVELIEFKCQNNSAVYGTCLFIKDQNIQIKNSLFLNNYAKMAGGAIYFEGRNKLFTLLSSKISENQAQYGGGIFTQNQSISNFSKMGSVVRNNKGTKYGNDQSTNPTHISITLNNYESIFFTNVKMNNQNTLIEEVMVSNEYLDKNNFLNVIYLPNGQKISEYKQFDITNRRYYSKNLTFRIVLLNEFREIYNNLSNSKCYLKSRRYNLGLSEDQQEQLSENFTNKNEILYNSESKDYNLDDLILLFNTFQQDDLILQLEIKCDRILIPYYNSQFPYEILYYHNNYSLQLNIKTYPCQYGEIINKTYGICEVCDYQNHFYQLKLNQEKCNLQDEISIKEVTSTLLNLYSGFWRAYFDTNQVEYCYNLPESCLGGWKEGDDSCITGHIGALCEQCDISDVRGDGMYSISAPYQCGKCTDQYINLFSILGISVWTLLTILMSTKNTVTIVINKLLVVKLKKAGLIIVSQPLNEELLGKILTNYLQIIMTLTTLRLSFPDELNYGINSTGNPIKTVAYSLDCFLIYLNQVIELHYLRMLWQFLMPIIYVLLFLGGYGLCILLKRCKYHSTVLSTTLINMYIILQPSLIEGFIKLMSFRTISGFKWISINVAYRFDTENHFYWVLCFCFPFFIIIAFIIPLILFTFLFQNRKDLDNNETRMNWGFLYNEYKKSGYFWEIVKLIEKELIIIVLAIYETRIIIKAILIYIIIFIYQQLTIKYQPYESKVLNQLDLTMTQVCGFSVVLGIGIYASQQNQEIIYPLYIILICINLYFMFLMIKILLKAYLIQLSKEISMICQKLKKYIKFQCFQHWRFFENKEENKKRISIRFNKIKKQILTVSRIIQQGRKETELSIIEDKNRFKKAEEKIQKGINSMIQKQQISSISRDFEITLASCKSGKADQKLFCKVFPESQQ